MEGDFSCGPLWGDRIWSLRSTKLNNINNQLLNMSNKKFFRGTNRITSFYNVLFTTSRTHMSDEIGLIKEHIKRKGKQW